MDVAGDVGRGLDAVDGVIRIVLADDHAVVRSALRMLLESQEGLEVVAEAGDVDNAVRYVGGHRPDVLILDLNMPGGPSTRALPEIRESSPETRTIVLTMDDNLALARESLRAGAVGYVLKDAADVELIKAVRSVASGGTYLQAELAARLAADREGNPDGLSDRELDVLRLIALGHTAAQIAEELHLSRRTIEAHRAHIGQKLGLGSRAELVRYALDHGLLQH